MLFICKTRSPRGFLLTQKVIPAYCGTSRGLRFPIAHYPCFCSNKSVCIVIAAIRYVSELVNHPLGISCVVRRTSSIPDRALLVATLDPSFTSNPTPVAPLRFVIGCIVFGQIVQSAARVTRPNWASPVASARTARPVSCWRLCYPWWR